MKIRIASDLHLDRCPMRARQDVGARVAIVAGDIANKASSRDLPKLLEDLFPEEFILAVFGNHEGYHEPDFDAAREEAMGRCAGTRVRILDRGAVRIGGVSFLGATLWTDFKLFGASRIESSMAAARSAMNDCGFIGRGGRLIEPGDTLEWHLRDLKWLRAESAARRAAGERIVAITHHAPSRGSVALRYMADRSSAGFASDLPSSDFEGLEAWIHGHVHSSFDYNVGGCRVLCNPRGYSADPDRSTENPAFDPDFTIEI